MTDILEQLAEALSHKKLLSKKEQVKPLFENARGLIENGWFKARKYKIDELLFQVLNEKGDSIKSLKGDLAEYLDTIPKKLRSNIPSRNELLDIISFMREEKRIQKWEEISKLYYIGNCGDSNYSSELHSESQAEIEKLVKILVPERNEIKETGRPEWDDEPERMRYVFLLTNFFQQLKHMEIRRSVHPFPILPVFFGAEGIGKTKFLEKMAKIFQPFVARSSFQAITEPEKYFRILCDNRVVFCEELVGVQKSDNEAFKSTYTSSMLDVRAFHTQDIDKHRIRAVTAANTNKPIWEVMRAHGKNRRFGNIFVRNEIDFLKLAEVDFLKILQGTTLCETHSEILKSETMYKTFCEPYQLETQNRDEFEQWIEARGLKRHDNNFLNTFVSFSNFHDDFKEYWISKGGYPKYYTKQFLKNKIKTHFNIDCRSDTDYTKGGERGLKVDTSEHNYGAHSMLHNNTVIPLRDKSKTG